METSRKYNRPPVRRSKDWSYAELRYKGKNRGVCFKDIEVGEMYLYADKILEMWRGEKSYTLIKRRTVDPAKQGRVYDGGILGYIEIYEDDEYGGSVEICLFIGYADRNLDWDDSGEVYDYQAKKTFVMPHSEFVLLIDAVELLEEQRSGLSEPSPKQDRSTLRGVRRSGRHSSKKSPRNEEQEF